LTYNSNKLNTIAHQRLFTVSVHLIEKWR